MKKKKTCHFLCTHVVDTFFELGKGNIPFNLDNQIQLFATGKYPAQLYVV